MNTSMSGHVRSLPSRDTYGGEAAQRAAVPLTSRDTVESLSTKGAPCVRISSGESPPVSLSSAALSTTVLWFQLLHSHVRGSPHGACGAG